ncbi:MJ0042-type zinc finger domain-containing protein [Brevundimonas goettingensis]|uniref:Zinc-ribbon domain-containing protein n=1 Tax=Brevundimonas goettingensis TaxID=2774190 RepID=A0A975GVF4_9CAUL|nr:MJ0042-type zinc finger domain-containing protein [Brevundimonas goettingensis]QTC90563.1 zinc-ribbon domain-containing protein [Brevundimonas goettingensis]
MILTCPSCATSYFTPDEAIGPTGRKVRCKTCAHVWHASLADEPLELTAPPEAALVEMVANGMVGASADGKGGGFGKRDDGPESLAETPAPELPKAFRARAEEQRRVRRAATHGAVWAGLASVFVGILGAAWLFRVEVVDLYPRAAAAYAAVGSPVNATGLNFEAMAIKVAPWDPGKVIVSGSVRNIRDHEIVSPPVRIALLDAHGAEIGFHIITIDAAPVLPGGVQGFAAVIPDPGAKISGIGADFVATPKAKARAENGHAAEDPHGEPAHGDDHAPPQAEHGADAGADHATAPAPTGHTSGPLMGQAAESGLRPAIDHEIRAPALAPVDAHPIDSGHGEAVSASHHG